MGTEAVVFDPSELEATLARDRQHLRRRLLAYASLLTVPVAVFVWSLAAGRSQSAHVQQIARDLDSARDAARMVSVLRQDLGGIRANVTESSAALAELAGRQETLAADVAVATRAPTTVAAVSEEVEVLRGEIAEAVSAMQAGAAANSREVAVLASRADGLTNEFRGLQARIAAPDSTNAQILQRLAAIERRLALLERTRQDGPGAGSSERGLLWKLGAAFGVGAITGAATGK